jgi:hypothetical protein
MHSLCDTQLYRPGDGAIGSSAGSILPQRAMSMAHCNDPYANSFSVMSALIATAPWSESSRRSKTIKNHATLVHAVTRPAALLAAVLRLVIV